MNIKETLHGTGVALVTPFNLKKKVDFDALKKLIYHVYKEIDYIVLLGTTGETSSLTEEEKKDIIELLKIYNNNKPIVLGIGGNCTKDVIRKINKIDLTSFEAILSVTPYYNRPTQLGIYEHFKCIAENTEKNIIIYNVPARTGSNILPDTVIKLAYNFKNIIGIKEASGCLLQSYEIIKKKPKEFLLISGDDSLSLPIILGGGDGVISVLAQAIPKDFSYMIKLALNNNVKESYNLYYKMYKMFDIIFKEGNPAGIKSLLNIIGICEPILRLPLISVSQELANQISLVYKNYLLDSNKN